jgi:dTDP-4-amino-4,6-dideoxygalactose transaminase
MICDFIEKKGIDHGRIFELFDVCRQSNVFTNNGPIKGMLEEKISELIFRGHEPTKRVCCMSSGTSALHALMFHFEAVKGRELTWGMPSFTFPSPFVHKMKVNTFDVDIDTLTIPKQQDYDVDGLILTNLFGAYVDIDYWVERCKAEDKILIFDNATSFMTTYKGKNISLYGDASFSSLHHTKYLGFGEGGFTVINDRMEPITNFGFDCSHVPSRLSSNFKMSDVAAAYILQHIERYDLKRHAEIQIRMVEALRPIKGVNLFCGAYRDGIMYGNIPLIFDRKVDRAEFLELGIEANKYYLPLSGENGNFVYDRIINLPIYQTMTDRQVDYMAKIVRQVASRG